MAGQVDTCDQCSLVEQVEMSEIVTTTRDGVRGYRDRMSLCRACRDARCPVCARFQGYYNHEIGRMFCQRCDWSWS